MIFEPIAIVGQACVLPDALSPRELWENVLAGKDSVSRAPAGAWGVPRGLAVGASGAASDRAVSDAGGHVRGFDARFDPCGFQLPEDEVRALDPLFQWVLHGAREALAPIGHERPSDRVGLVLGNLSFPSTAMARYAEHVWLGERSRSSSSHAPHARSRFMSGLPAHLAARALGLGAGAFALDAACASSLYAIKLACDRLHDRRADVMLAGAVNGADDLLLHAGFTALAALSPSGRSRPFHRDADGLVPAHGAAFVTLKRLADALSAGDRVLGVIRGVGLSNDGRGRGLLVPSEHGQERAVRLAYAIAGVTPAEIGLLECHATGTAVGDAAEIHSTARVFAGCRDVPIGSLKSNLGHLITAAGAAGLIKVLAAMDAGVRPGALHTEAPIDALRGSPFRLLSAAEPWVGPRRAAVSAFGFGGNNAHLIVEAWDGARPTASTPSRPRVEIAVVGIGARVGGGDSAIDLARSLFTATPDRGPRRAVEVAQRGLKFPPRDLERTLGQQLLALEAAREASSSISLPAERTAVLVGMGCDPEIPRCGARFRAASWAREWARDAGTAADEAWIARLRDAFCPPVDAATVLGSMPNIPANRVNSQLDLGGPSFTVSSEEASGLVALSLAARALAAGEIDAALVGASDLSHEIVHRTALAALGVDRPPGDAAVVLALKRLDDARRDGDTIHAILDDGALVDQDRSTLLSLGESGLDLASLFGHAHAASGLLHVAAAVLAIRHGARPHLDREATPWLGERRARVDVTPLEGARTELGLRAGGDAAPLLFDAPPRLHVFSGSSAREALAALEARRESREGPARLVIVASDDAELARRAEAARRWLLAGGPAPEGVAFRASPLAGELGFVFTGAAAAYAGMGRELCLALPEASAALARRSAGLCTATAWIYERGGAPAHPLDQLWGASFLTQLHAEITRSILRLEPRAAIGYSSGESNALLALGAWSDVDALIRASAESGIFTREIGGEMAAIERARARLGARGRGFTSHVISAPVAEVRALVDREPLAHLVAVNAPDEVVIGGEPSACARVLAALGGDRAIALGYDLAVHCPELEEIRGAWWSLHHRPTRAVPGVRFYTNATCASYEPTAERAADAITAQAVTTIDFPRTIERAYQDGVRVFLEHGPRGTASGWIRRTLGDRDHLAIPLDLAGRSPITSLLSAVAWLIAAGVPVDDAALVDRLARASRLAPDRGPVVSIAAHPEPVRVPARSVDPQPMPRAPRLAPALPPAPVLAVAAAPPAPIAPASAPVVASDVLQRALHQHAELSRRHQAFIAEQAAVHAQFLATHQRMLSAFTGVLAASSLRAPGLGTAIAPAPTANLAPAPTANLAPAPTANLPPAPTAIHAPAPTAIHAPTLPGPKLDRAALTILAGGRISSVFGPLFESQDGYRRQVRMPEPPLLLADRVTGIDAVPGSMGTGSLWTETDIRAESWYLSAEGRMPAGILIESGQADLLLISWLGVDRLNKGERVYRLLGCQMVFHGELPRAGQTLRYAIHVDGHATQGDVRLFFFHYDCEVDGRPQLTVRGGQAGFFTDEELAASGGVLWDAATDDRRLEGRDDPPALLSEKRSLDQEALLAFAAGRPFDCFGAGFEITRAHVRTPRIAEGDMLLLHRVTDIDPRGGPWGRGYLRAEADVSPDDWFFAGHFKNDPCMPGTLMLEGSLQAMAIYLAALGFTLDRDGARFEPVPEEKYTVSCRGQVTPSSKRVVYEIFIESLSAGSIPTLHADLLGTVDGLKAFHARRVGLRLVPDWPLETWALEGPPRAQETGAPLPLAALGGLLGWIDPRPSASIDGFSFDYASLLACAWGRPSRAFGPLYARFDGPRRVARLPGPPYHFMSRVTAVEGPMGGMKIGSRVEVEYDIPDRAWYFAESAHPTMPFCVLLEAALQPCGWLASYVGSTLATDVDLLFRNLDGTGTVFEDLGPGAGTLRTRVELLGVSRSGEMILETFSVECTLGDRRVFSARTGFGFFPPEAFVSQVGLPPSDVERARFAVPPMDPIDLGSHPDRYFAGPLRLPGSMLRMIDRVTGIAPRGGRAGLGVMRAEKDVDPGEWFFKAHFFQDPVQPGSLGIEALIQLVMAYAIDRGLGDGLPSPRFEPLMRDRAVTWKYRGQVVPRNGRVTLEIEITEVSADARGRFVIAEGWLSVDDKRIYQVKDLGVRVVAGAEPALVDRLRDHWRRALGVGAWPAEDLHLALLDRFVGRVALPDPAALARIAGRGCLFLANHQVAIESLLFTLIAPAITSVPCAALAKIEHRESWMGRLVALTFSHPGVADPGLLIFLDRADRSALLRFAETSASALREARKSVLVHVQGTRSLAARDPVTRVSSVLLDLAISTGAPVVPVRFTGGLPVDPLSARLDWPIGYGKQAVWIGAPIEPEALAALPYRDRAATVCAAIDGLGPRDEEPAAPDPSFAVAVDAWMRSTGAPHEAAVLFVCLARAAAPSEPTQRLLAGARAGHLAIGPSPEDRWLAELAAFLFGPRGPRVIG